MVYNHFRGVALSALLCALAYDAHGQLVEDMVDSPVTLSQPAMSQTAKAATYEFASQEILAAYSGIALQGSAAGDSLSGWVRFDGEEEWLPLYIVRSATDAAFLAAYRGESVREGQSFVLRFVAGVGDSLSVLDAGVFLETDPEQPSQTGYGVHHPASAIIAPDLITRNQWGAAPFVGTPLPLNRPSYDRITLHHTAGFSATTLAEGTEQVRRIQDFHQNGRGWRDIGYQFLMDQEGRLYQGRPFLRNVPFSDGPPLAHGAHVGGANTGNIGVSLMGCYHPPEGSGCLDEMTQPALDSLLVVFAFLSERYGPAPGDIGGHRDFSATACPGDNNYRQLPDIRAAVQDLLITGNATLGSATLAARADSEGLVTVEWTFTANHGIQEIRIDRLSANSSSVVYTSTTAEDGRIVDTEITAVGPITYALSVRGSRGREQILGTYELTVEAPEDFVLAQNFPNPASGSTSIRYFLTQPGLVSLEVFDAAGRRIATLEDAYREEDRWHVAELDTRDLAGGIYFYRVTLDGFAGVVHNTVNPLIVVR